MKILRFFFSRSNGLIALALRFKLLTIIENSSNLMDKKMIRTDPAKNNYVKTDDAIFHVLIITSWKSEVTNLHFNYLATSCSQNFSNTIFFRKCHDVLLSCKGSFFIKKQNQDPHVRLLKIVWNVQKTGLEKMSGWLCVRACVRVLRSNTTVKQAEN